ncbi:hypothetical protein TRIATDRAFT_131548 [Trichoderma atroviride IMI 206040]|uniref:Uncharacterized protein n=1 Tax=Hypocrea atroviridis (strain ATCC 20476 / IMI 206040) TaxID=452589 RepID=G9NY71_HYPAI|nr:uncharacterized protein TRIATDRAFT_131548 [Trichoderma atroviride IMI 206040]EHK44613.1 hypothetical protein TRIATDRAFT_131548 [Trichoderma atroviride IMI 206040]
MITVTVSTLTLTSSASASKTNVTVVGSTITRTLPWSTGSSALSGTVISPSPSSSANHTSGNTTRMVTTIVETISGPTTSTGPQWTNTTTVATDHESSHTGSVIVTTLYPNSTTATPPCTHSWVYPYPNISDSTTTCTRFPSGNTTLTRCWAMPLTTGAPESSLRPTPLYTSTCNTTGTANGTYANATVAYTRTHTYPYPLPTTFETSTTSKDHESGSKGFAYPVPTVAIPSEETMPRNPNYPWGAGSPLHRHQNVTGLGDGILGGRSVLVDWGKTAVHRLKALFKKHVDEDEQGGEEEE